MKRIVVSLFFVSIVFLGLTEASWSAPPRVRPGQPAVPDRSQSSRSTVTPFTPPSVQYTYAYANCTFSRFNAPEFSQRLSDASLDTVDQYYLVDYSSSNSPIHYEYWERIPDIPAAAPPPEELTFEYQKIYKADIISLSNLDVQQHTLSDNRSYEVRTELNVIRQIINYEGQAVSSIIYFNRDGRRSRFEIYEEAELSLIKYYNEGYVAKLDVYNENSLAYYRLFLYDEVTKTQLQSVVTRTENQLGQISTRLVNNLIRTDLFDGNGQRRRTFIYQNTNELVAIHLFDEQGIPMLNLPLPDYRRTSLTEEENTEDSETGETPDETNDETSDETSDE